MTLNSFHKRHSGYIPLFVGIAIAVLMVILFEITVNLNASQLRESVDARVTASAERLAISIAPAAWDVFQKSSDRTFSDVIADSLLEAEFKTDILTGVVVYGNFGHVLLGKIKSDLGTIETMRQIQSIDNYKKRNESVRVSIKQNVMTIGHIEVLYSYETISAQLKRSFWLNFITFTLITISLEYSVLMMFRANREKDRAAEALSQLQTTQEKLIESEKLSSLGSLVAGVAHEMNTPLGTSLTSFSLIETDTKALKKSLDSGEMTKSQLDDFLTTVLDAVKLAENGLRRAIDLVKNFKQVAADQTVEDVREIPIKHYVEEILSTLSITIRRAKCTYEILGDDNLRVRTVPGSLAQIITNLVNNSLLHGFDEKPGHIQIEILPGTDGFKIEIFYRDNGKGMAPNVVEHIFDPFFTTKRGKGGIGLGMNIVHNIVTQKLNGSIMAESVQGNGVEFTLKLNELP